MSLKAATRWYERSCEAVAATRPRLGPDELLDLPYEHFAADPAGVLADLCGFLGVEATPEYLAACAAVVWPSTRRRRDTAEWTADDLARVEALIGRYSFLEPLQLRRLMPVATGPARAPSVRSTGLPAEYAFGVHPLLTSKEHHTDGHLSVSERRLAGRGPGHPRRVRGTGRRHRALHPDEPRRRSRCPSARGRSTPTSTPPPASWSSTSGTSTRSTSRSPSATTSPGPCWSRATPRPASRPSCRARSRSRGTSPSSMALQTASPDPSAAEIAARIQAITE